MGIVGGIEGCDKLEEKVELANKNDLELASSYKCWG